MNCRFCNKKIESWRSYCNWDCQVAFANELGGDVIAPNELPIRCIRADGTMLEHEHADHPDYRFPIEIEFHGKRDPDVHELEYATERHALIYDDDCIAVTLSERCYTTWLLSTGLTNNGSWKDWKISDESLKKIRAQRLDWPGEVCKKCHKRNVVGFDVDDETWNSVVRDRWNVLCTTCFDEQAQLSNVQYVFKKVYPVSWNMWIDSSELAKETK